MATISRPFCPRNKLRSTEHPMRITHKLLRHARIKLAIALRRLIQTDHLNPHHFSNVDTVPHDRLHQLAVVLHHWHLAGVEAVGFRSAEAEVNPVCKVYLTHREF